MADTMFWMMQREMTSNVKMGGLALNRNIVSSFMVTAKKRLCVNRWWKEGRCAEGSL